MTKSLLPERINKGCKKQGHALCVLWAALLLGALSAAPAARAQAPQLSSVTPPNGTTNAPVNGSLVFVFDQPMDTDVFLIPSFPPFLVGNLEVTPPSHYISGDWSDDGRTLTCPALSPLPAGTEVTWRLNPAGNSSPLTSAGGTPLATVSGSFRTAGGGGGTNECDQTGLPPGWGSYSITKNIAYEQSSSADPVADTNSFLFGAFVRSPASGPAVTAGSITVLNNAPEDLEGFAGTFAFSDTPATEAALDAAYPGGNYTLQFTQTGQPERVIAMTMPALGPPVPKISNFSAAQAAAQDFTLSWGAFTGAGANDFINLIISDNLGGVAFQAPDLCVPRTLLATATSIVIPANTLNTNMTYTATLSFGRVFYNSTNAVPQMAGFGNILRSTSFTIDTGSGGPGLPVPANLTGSRLLPNGNPEMDLTGTPARTYTIQRTGDLGNPNWTAAGTATMDGTGSAVFQDTQSNKTFPLFYRAVGN